MSQAAKFLFGEPADFGVAGYDASSVESFLRDAAAQSAATGRVPWPAPTLQEADAAFGSLLATDYSIRPSEELIGVAPFTHCGLDASDHFMHDRRMACGGYDRLSPVEMWRRLADDSGSLWKRVLGCASRFAKTDALDEGFLRAVTRLSGGCYNAAQFKPAVALAVIRHFRAKSVLDPCAGWGDRLAAACAAGVQYLGVDPNTENHIGYAAILARYGHEGRQKTVDSCFEDFDVPHGCFDLVFTSPPYFDTERYAAGTQAEGRQSWRRYSTLPEWIGGFLRQLVLRSKAALLSEGILAVNLKDGVRKVPGGKDTIRLCDALDVECEAAGLQKVGVIGMQMKSAPGNVPSYRPPAGKALIEPILCYRRA